MMMGDRHLPVAIRWQFSQCSTCTQEENLGKTARGHVAEWLRNGLQKRVGS